jgi:transcriptional regulator with XRE-family HTH domain
MSMLRQIRMVKGLSQGEVAREVDRDPAVISRLENGLIRNTPAGVELKRAVAQYFELSPEVVFPELKDGDK